MRQANYQEQLKSVEHVQSAMYKIMFNVVFYCDQSCLTLSLVSKPKDDFSFYVLLGNKLVSPTHDKFGKNG